MRFRKESFQNIVLSNDILLKRCASDSMMNKQYIAERRRLHNSPSKIAAYDFAREFLKIAQIDAGLIPAVGAPALVDIGNFSVRFKATPLRIDDFIFSVQARKAAIEYQKGLGSLYQLLEEAELYKVLGKAAHHCGYHTSVYPSKSRGHIFRIDAREIPTNDFSEHAANFAALRRVMGLYLRE